VSTIPEHVITVKRKQVCHETHKYKYEILR
jgi:hypothetical protein